MNVLRIRKCYNGIFVRERLQVLTELKMLMQIFKPHTPEITTGLIVRKFGISTRWVFTNKFINDFFWISTPGPSYGPLEGTNIITSDAGSQYCCGWVGRGSQPPSSPNAPPNLLSNSDTHEKHLKRCFFTFWLELKDGQTNGPMDGPMDGQSLL